MSPAMPFSISRIVRTYGARALSFAHLLSRARPKRRRSSGPGQSGASREHQSATEDGSAAEIEAREAERDRWAAIFADPSAMQNPIMAAAIAGRTSWSPSRVIGFLEGLPAPKAHLGLYQRMSAARPSRLGPGNYGDGDSPDAKIAASWARAAAPFMPADGDAK